MINQSFLAAISTLAEKKDIIESFFTTTQINKNGIYSLKVSKNGV